MSKELYAVTIAAYATVYVEAEDEAQASEIAQAACDKNELDDSRIDEQLQDSNLEVYSYETLPTDKRDIDRRDLVFANGMLMKGEVYLEDFVEDDEEEGGDNE